LRVITPRLPCNKLFTSPSEGWKCEVRAFSLSMPASRSRSFVTVTVLIVVYRTITSNVRASPAFNSMFRSTFSDPA
jgi:hypothetical protein